jgi:hypothetical protein
MHTASPLVGAVDAGVRRHGGVTSVEGWVGSSVAGASEAEIGGARDSSVRVRMGMACRLCGAAGWPGERAARRRKHAAMIIPSAVVASAVERGVEEERKRCDTVGAGEVKGLFSMST